MKFNPLNTQIGLALGGGAAKGIAHIGVLKAFEEENIKIDYLSGTSVGALIASYYAFGKSVDEIMHVGRDLNIKRVIHFTLKKRGFFTTSAIREMVLKDLGDVQIEDALTPLAICTTDITTGEQVIFQKGSLVDAICASVAVPGLYIPVEINGRMLVDGGITENVPISILEKMGAGITIGIDLNGVSKYPHPQDFVQVMGNAFDIAIDLRTRDQLKDADICLSLDLSKYSRFDNTEYVDELLREGYVPMKKKIKKLLWYKRTNLIQYSIKLFKEFVPLKLPKYVKSFFNKHLKSINIK
jgi:NTE family protein